MKLNLHVVLYLLGWQDHGYQADGLKVWEDQLLHFPEAAV